MPDDDLRPEPARPRIPPPPGGFDAAVRGARVKRQRRAAAAIGACASLVGVIGLGVTALDGVPDRLRPVNPTVESSGTATPQPLAPSATAGPRSRPKATSSRGGSAGAAPARPATTASPRSTRPPIAGDRTATPMRRDVVPFGGESDCDNRYVDSTGQWCQRYSGPDRARAGSPVALSVDLCRVGTAGTATFTSTKEADLHVYARDGRATTQWRWSSGRRFTARREVVPVEGGTCLRWTTTWSTRTDRGPVIAPGVYTIRAQVDAQVSGTAGTGIGVSRERAFTVEA